MLRGEKSYMNMKIMKYIGLGLLFSACLLMRGQKQTSGGGLIPFGQ